VQSCVTPLKKQKGRIKKERDDDYFDIETTNEILNDFIDFENQLTKKYKSKLNQTKNNKISPKSSGTRPQETHNFATSNGIDVSLFNFDESELVESITSSINKSRANFPIELDDSSIDTDEIVEVLDVIDAIGVIDVLNFTQSDESDDEIGDILDHSFRETFLENNFVNMEVPEVLIDMNFDCLSTSLSGISDDCLESRIFDNKSIF